MRHNGTGNPAARRGLWLCLAFLAGLLWSSNLLGRYQVPPKEVDGPTTPAPFQMIIRGPEEPMVGQRCTIEVFVLNTGTTPLKGLDFQAKLDACLEQDSKEPEHRDAIETIAPDDVRVVRLHVTPRKSGPGGIDFTLRVKGGATEQVRYVWPVLPEGGARAPELGSGLKFKITTLRECLVDRPGIVLVNVVNTGPRAMREKQDLVVSYGSMGQAGQVLQGDDRRLGGLELLGHEMKGGGRKTIEIPIASNPTRQIPVTLPALAADESITLPVRITPRRLGDLGIAITAATPRVENPQPLVTTRLAVKFDPNQPAERLLPVRATAALPTSLPKKLAEVPEVSLEDPCPQNMKGEEAFEHVSALIEKINHINTTKRDAFVELLASKRAEMRGLPFVMGDACRLTPERGQHFLAALSTLRQAMVNPAQLASQLPNLGSQPANDVAAKAHIAALVQVVGPEGAQANQQAVQYLATLPQSEASQALARLAIFAEEEQVRSDAVAALATHREKDVTDILVAGLSYPWPGVAQRAADAIVKLKRKDLLPQLVEALDRPDPRAPQMQEKEGKQVPVVRELVRINHLRNCLLCHSPMDASKAPGATEEEKQRILVETANGPFGGRGRGFATGLTAPVPLPGQSLPVPTPQSGYGHFTVPDTLLAFDVTYLRQDFSVKLPVTAAQPWPEMQRFDFLVRTREVTEKEAEATRALLRKAQDGDLSPYQRAALSGLRQLTGRDTEPNAAAWRQLLAQNK
jgi:hypothetical protein